MERCTRLGNINASYFLMERWTQILHWYEMETDMSTCRLNHIGIYWHMTYGHWKLSMVNDLKLYLTTFDTWCPAWCLKKVDSVPHGLLPRNESIHGCPNVSTRTTAPVLKVILKPARSLQDGENEPRPAVGMGMDGNGWERWRLVKQDELPTSNLERVGVETIYIDESALWHRTGFRSISYTTSITRALVFVASDRLLACSVKTCKEFNILLSILVWFEMIGPYWTPKWLV